MKTARTESANGLLIGRKHRDFVNLNGLGYAPIITTGHFTGDPIPEGLSPEESKTAWEEWNRAIRKTENAEREFMREWESLTHTERMYRRDDEERYYRLKRIYKE